MCDEEIFEINDFSTSSDWERFISDLEEILTQWNLMNQNPLTIDDGKIQIGPETLQLHNSPLKNQNSLKSSSKLFSDPRRWQQKQEQLKFGKVSFCLQYYCFKKDSSVDSTPISTSESSVSKGSSDQNIAWRNMNSIENDWPVSGHPLVRYYGLSQFLVLSPLNGETISTEDRARHLIGSASIALHNIDCEVPFFCQISSLSRKLFMGVGHSSNGFRTYFEMIHFPEVPPSFRYLNELMVLFKKKLYSSFSYNSKIFNEEEISSNQLKDNDNIISMPKIKISIRFTYILTKWPMEYLLFNNQSNSTLNEWFSYFHRLDANETIRRPVLPNSQQNIGDPLLQVQLATTWPSVAEELITDNAYHSDLQPRNAPRWSIRTLFFEDYQPGHGTNPYCRTVELLKTFFSLKIHQNGQLLNYILNNNNDELGTNDIDVRSAFDRLSSTSVPSPVPFQRFGTSTSQLISSVSNLVQKAVIISGGHIPMEHVEAIVQNVFNAQPTNEFPTCLNLLKQLKSAPYDSLSWRIANLCSNVYIEIRQIPTLAQIWKCFLNKLREHWHSGHLLPHLTTEQEKSSIDHSTCLFHQKLQMLNCCIEEKIRRENLFVDKISADESSSKFDLDDSDPEEFFDAEEDQQEDSTSKADGQLHPFKDSQGQPIYLLENPGQQIQVPLTQNPAPMTEDALARQVQSLSQIEDPKLRIRLQSASLLSDMEAFKASNPGCKFEDFIRWHSPRDWVEITNETTLDKVEFGLSRRMQESSTWKELWELARPCPVRRQKRLFNYTREAEEILQYFQTITPAELMNLLCPIVAKSVTVQLLQYRQEILQIIQANLPSYKPEYLFSFEMSVIEQLFAQNDYHKLCQNLADLELKLMKFYSLFKKLSYSYGIVNKNYLYKRGKTFEEILKKRTEDPPEKIQLDENKKIKSDSTKLRLKENKQTSGLTNELTGGDFIRFIVDLLQEPEVEFSNSTLITQLIVQLFFDSDRFQYEQTTSVGDRLPIVNSFDHQDEDSTKIQKPQMATLPVPTGKEFIIRAPAIARPAPYSRTSSNRMYCFLSKDFRLATAFTEDTAYF